MLPDRVRRWAEAHAARPIVDATPVAGGITGTKWILRLGEGDPLVLRWADPAEWGDVGREHVRREALAAGLLAGTGLPVPRLIAADVDGLISGAPADLLSWRPGQTRYDPLGPAALTALADLAVAVHGQPVPVERRPPAFSFRGPAEPQVPGWVRWPALWRRAIEIRRAGPPATPSGLLHRDFHFGNILWQGDAVSGLIDWAEVSWGPPDLDVAHACSDFAMVHSATDAETFRAEYVRRGGRLDPDPDAAAFWVVSDILGFLPDPAHILPAVTAARPDLTADSIRRGLEDLLALALQSW